MAKQQLRAANMKMEAQQKRVTAATNKAANALEEVGPQRPAMAACPLYGNEHQRHHYTPYSSAD